MQIDFKKFSVLYCVRNWKDIKYIEDLIGFCLQDTKVGSIISLCTILVLKHRAIDQDVQNTLKNIP